MSSFEVETSKYDPENDPHRPKEGDIINDGKWRVVKSEPIEVSKLLTMIQENPGKDPDLVPGSDAVGIMGNPTRPFLKYIVWYETL